MRKKSLADLLAAAACVLACFASPSRAAPGDLVNGISAEAGSGNGAEMWRIGVQHDWQSKWLQRGNWHMGGYWDLQAGRWSGDAKRTITDVGLTPVFRYQQTVPSSISPYVEGAIGFHLIEPVRMDEHRGFSSAFQFGDHVGVGARFGEHGRYDLGLRFQHLSNAGIKKPNNGINFTQLRFQLHLD
jgi:lipid A 3-O-deacylase